MTKGRIGYNIFDRIVSRYDLLNHLLSFFQDIRWRRVASKYINSDAYTILDVACGTGDFIIALLNQNKNHKIVGLDLSMHMLRVARRKIKDLSMQPVLCVAGDVSALPFKDCSFNAVTCAFGFRNFQTLYYALSEFRRILKPGGVLVSLELGIPDLPILSTAFKFYLRLLPILASLFGSSFRAYKYLSDSIKNFMKPTELRDLLLACGFRSADFYLLSGGIAFIHTAYKSELALG